MRILAFRMIAVTEGYEATRLDHSKSLITIGYGFNLQDVARFRTASMTRWALMSRLLQIKTPAAKGDRCLRQQRDS